MNCTGDVTVAEAWNILAQDEKAVLVDVRTQAEWSYVGICDLSDIDKSPLLVSWQEFPHMAVNPAFADMIMARDIPRHSPLYFICRSGVRSRAAAVEMIAAGYEKCFNILDGFEGGLDASGHRGTCGGWKASGLPWTQN